MGKKRIKKIEETTEEIKISHESKPKTKGKKIKRTITKGQAHIQSTYNNTIITLTDLNGAVLAWASAGLVGFKGAKKSTPYAATITAKAVAEKVKKINLQEIDVFVKGIGSGRESAIRGLAASGLVINSIVDVTPIPHNGCRPPKVRRV